MFNKIREIFSNIDKDKTDEDEYKIFLELENSYSFRDIINIYKDNDLYYDYLMELWILLPEKKEDKLCAMVQYLKNKSKFEVVYMYPRDENKDRNFHGILNFEELFKFPFIDDKVYKIEFCSRTIYCWEFIHPFERRPQLYYVIADIDSSKRFSMAGITDTGVIETFRLVDFEHESHDIHIEYHIENQVFTIKASNIQMEFKCKLIDKWRYFVNEEEKDNIDEVFDAFWRKK